MAPAFMVSAPGKVIVFGEHAAVYNKPAIAAAISLRSYLLVTTLSKSQRTVTLNFRDIHLHHTWSIDSLPWHIFNLPSKKQFYHSRVESLDQDLLAAIEPHAAAVSVGLEEKQRKMHVRSATAFLYLFLSLGSQQSPGFVYTLRSTIPIGAGLGSSASVCVCLSTALLLQIRALAGPHPNQPVNEAKDQIERINRWAFVGELCSHGDPSGVDNTVSSQGKAVLFRKNTNAPSSVTPLLKFPALRFLLVDTKQQRSTASQVEKVRALKESQPVTIESVLEAIGKLTESALDHFSSADFNGNGAAGAIDSLGTLIRVNHGLLDALGVSHRRLERVRELADDAGVGWTKLTGAGGGGCAITLLRPGVDEETVEELAQELSEHGFEKHEAMLGVDGVGVLWPAIFRDTFNGESEEIDQEKFESVIGTHGIEQLVGVGAREGFEGWKFWTHND
ncbi:Mevalonate kinase [Microsporum canis]|uniref:Mevalonate kinase n=1 Tax=Arthroderma otae (strain ATCC MYA-4605 / CBS 113480) TaxID=554155 RepID=C5FCE5_ARTOC|nr:mevalonate kinase [Microsporum canis CBS 113480]EEQ27389.1 mevalonate kinase [Microsporum canis CBS 113480]